MPTPYPPAPPTVSGNNITVDAFLNNPARVQRAITDLTRMRFLADRVLAEGPRATGGAVLYDQLTSGGDFFTARDVQAIEPATEFPILNSGEVMPLVAAVTKWGGSAVFSYEAVRRDRRDILARELVRLRNTIVRKIDTVAMAALNAAPLYTQAAAAVWTTATNDLSIDIFTAVSTIDEQDMGYVASWGIIHPSDVLSIRKNTAIRSLMPRENRSSQPGPDLIASADLSGFLGIDNWYVSNRQTAGTVHIGAGKPGSISDELPLYSRTVDEETKERYRVMAARIAVPFITDPKAVVKITGVR